MVTCGMLQNAGIADKGRPQALRMGMAGSTAQQQFHASQQQPARLQKKWVGSLQKFLPPGMYVCMSCICWPLYQVMGCSIYLYMNPTTILERVWISFASSTVGMK